MPKVYHVTVLQFAIWEAIIGRKVMALKCWTASWSLSFWTERACCLEMACSHICPFLYGKTDHLIGRYHWSVYSHLIVIWCHFLHVSAPLKCQWWWPSVDRVWRWSVCWWYTGFDTQRSLVDLHTQRELGVAKPLLKVLSRYHSVICWWVRIQYVVIVHLAGLCAKFVEHWTSSPSEPLIFMVEFALMT